MLVMIGNVPDTTQVPPGAHRLALNRSLRELETWASDLAHEAREGGGVIYIVSPRQCAYVPVMVLALVDVSFDLGKCRANELPSMAPLDSPAEQLPLLATVANRTVADVQRDLKAHRHEGISCECCGAMVRVYRRSIHSAMAVWLIDLAMASRGDTWVHADDLPARGGDYAKLVWWGLVEQREKDPEDTKRRTSGQWRCTPDGYDFAKGRTTVPRFADVYRGKLLDLHGEPVDIVHCLNDRFDFQALWRGEAG